MVSTNYCYVQYSIAHIHHPQRHHPPPPRRHSLDGGDYSRTLDFPTDLHRVHPLDREFRGPSQSISHSAVIVPFFVAEVPDPFESKPTINCDNRDGIWKKCCSSFRILYLHTIHNIHLSIHVPIRRPVPMGGESKILSLFSLFLTTHPRTPKRLSV